MAFFVPVLAAVGGGSAIAGGLTLATAALGVGSAVQAHKAGKVVEAENKLQAKAEGDAARTREIERKRALLRAVATQHASAAAGGIAFGGSQAAIARRDIEDFRNDLLADRANTATAQRILRARGQSARASGDLGAVRSLVDTGTSIYEARA